MFGGSCHQGPDGGGKVTSALLISVTLALIFSHCSGVGASPTASVKPSSHALNSVGVNGRTPCSRGRFPSFLTAYVEDYFCHTDYRLCKALQHRNCIHWGHSPPDRPKDGLDGSRKPMQALRSFYTSSYRLKLRLREHSSEMNCQEPPLKNNP